jgi:hypothetical protein
VRPRWATDPDVELADMLVHEAGHAVIAWELGITIVHLRFSAKDWSGRMPFIGALSRFSGDLASERAREAVEKDMLVYHAGLMAQRLFHYDSTHRHVPAIDLAGVWETCHWAEHDVDLIDEWSDYIEERVRVMLYRPATWARVIALAQEIARRLYLSGADIDTFLAFVNVTNAVSPKSRAWKRTEYDFGQDIGVLDLSPRARGALARAEITTIAHLLTYSGRDIRGIPRAGEKTAGEIEEAVRTSGLTLGDEPLWERELRVQRARAEEAKARTALERRQSWETARPGEWEVLA